MSCNDPTGFIREVMETIEALYRKHSFDQLVIKHGNPLRVSMRGHVPNPEKPGEFESVVMRVDLAIGLDDLYQNFGNLEFITEIRQDNGNRQHDPVGIET